MGRSLILGSCASSYRPLSPFGPRSSKLRNHHSTPCPTCSTPTPDRWPPKLTGLKLTITPDEGLEGETLTATAELSFSGDEPMKGGISVVFTDDATGKIVFPNGQSSYSAPTNASGKAMISFELSAKERDLQQPFDEMKDEERRRAGEEAPSRARPDRAPKNAFERVKQRAPDAFDALDRESEKISQEESVEEDAETNDGEAIVAADWDDGPTEGDLIDTGAGSIMAPAPPAAIPPAFALGSEAAGETVPFQKLYSLTVSAKAVASPMGTAHDSKKVSVMSNRCPPGSTANPEPQDGGQPGQPPMGSIEKVALDNELPPI